jgi:hypothetical protein
MCVYLPSIDDSSSGVLYYVPDIFSRHDQTTMSYWIVPGTLVA